jgi:ABC-type transport system involved in multi-copper enzyme maturation permease subunit
MLNKLLDRFIVISGDWNAQLFRELKSRLTVKNFVITTICSLLAQGWFLRSALLNLPISNVVDGHPSYCEFDLSPLFNSDNICQLPRSSVGYANRHIDVINWSKWWSELFTGLSGLIAVFLVVAGVYLLAKDWRIEEKRGTLNFVRLSPQSAGDIFLGKILGVPVLIYLAAGLAYSLWGLLAYSYNNPISELKD